MGVGVPDYLIAFFLDIVTAEKRALEQQVKELKQCLATCHTMRSQAMSFNHKVGEP